MPGTGTLPSEIDPSSSNLCRIKYFPLLFNPICNPGLTNPELKSCYQ